MKVYVFGNQDLPQDNIAIKAAQKLDGNVKSVEFVFVKPNEDLPFVKEVKVVIMDAVEGANKVMLFDEGALDKLVLSPRTSVHDFDLGFQLRYLSKLGKLGEVKIIGLPVSGKLTEENYSSIHSILRKLVAQDIQGS
jgi:Ni,Fe-hydrogenase maturation factor